MEYEGFSCEYCGKIVNTAHGLAIHKKYCASAPSNGHNREMRCAFCEKVCKNENSLVQHQVRCNKNPHRICVSGAVQKRVGLWHGPYSIVKENRKCPFCKKEWVCGKSGYKAHINYCKANPNRLKGSFFGKHHSKSSIEKISNSQRLAHKEGRNSSWIGRRKRSYAEQSWFNVFSSELGVDTFKNNYYVEGCHYWLDFAWPEKMFYFEVDGKSHYTKNGIKHDLKRTEILAKAGWILIGRCNWSEYQKLSFEDKQAYVRSIVQKVLGK